MQQWQQQRQDGQTRDEADDLVSLYLTAPPIVSLSLSLLLVEAIISQAHLSYCLILLCLFVSLSQTHYKPGASSYSLKLWPGTTQEDEDHSDKDLQT